MDHQQAIATHAAERYLLQELNESDRDAFEDHYFSCVECADDVRVGARLEEGVRSGLLAAAVAPATNVIPIGVRRRSTMSFVMPWAVAASMALVAGYQALWVVPGLRASVVRPGATVPILLRPASRGAVTTVSSSGGDVIAFSLDLNSAADAGTSLSYDLRTIDGHTVASGSVVAPPPGTPLLLVVPVKTAPPGDYILLVGRSGGNAPVAEYRFAVTKP